MALGMMFGSSLFNWSGRIKYHDLLLLLTPGEPDMGGIDGEGGAVVGAVVIPSVIEDAVVGSAVVGSAVVVIVGWVEIGSVGRGCLVPGESLDSNE